MTKKWWWGCFINVFFIIVCAIFGIRFFGQKVEEDASIHSGGTKSVEESKRRGVFVSGFTVSPPQFAWGDMKIHFGDAWVEKSYEIRYDSVVANKPRLVLMNDYRIRIIINTTHQKKDFPFVAGLHEQVSGSELQWLYQEKPDLLIYSFNVTEVPKKSVKIVLSGKREAAGNKKVTVTLSTK